MATTQQRILLDTAFYLNSKLMIQNQESIINKSKLKKETLEGKQAILNDIKDATETYDREYIERQETLNNTEKNLLNTTQDFSLFILFSGYAIFTMALLVYIFLNSKAPVIATIMYLTIISLIFVLMVFMIQRFG
jgi:hypothetical protein